MEPPEKFVTDCNRLQLLQYLNLFQLTELKTNTEKSEVILYLLEDERDYF